MESLTIRELPVLFMLASCIVLCWVTESLPAILMPKEPPCLLVF